MFDDNLAAALGGLRDQPPPAPFAPVEHVRRRGRQRARNRLYAVTAASLAVIGAGGGIGLAAGQGRETADPVDTAGPSASASAAPSTPAPSSVPPSSAPPSTSSRPLNLNEMLMRPADVGPGAVRTDGGEPFEHNPDQWLFARQCEEYRRADYPSLDRRAGLVWADWMRPEQRYVFEVVEVYDAGRADDSIADIVKAVATCDGRRRVPDEPAASWKVVQRDFTGDQSLLIELDRGGFVTHFGVVRVGDAVATVTFDRALGGRDYTVQLTRAAGQRLTAR